MPIRVGIFVFQFLFKMSKQNTIALQFYVFTFVKRIRLFHSFVNKKCVIQHGKLVSRGVEFANLENDARKSVNYVGGDEEAHFLT